MVTIQAGAPTLLSGYQLHLPAFEGPLDVLLHLIERQHLAITDISLALVTDQFLAHVADLHGAPPALLADFVAMGSRLTVLKSRSLLPRPPVADEEPGPSDLAHELLRYRQLRSAADALAVIHQAGATSFARSSRATPDQRGVTDGRLTLYDAASLRRALRRRLAVLPQPARVLEQRRVVSLRAMVDRILSLHRRGEPLPFSHIVTEYRTRSDIATAFLALLVLVRRGQLRAAQQTRFGEITLHGPASPSQAHARRPVATAADGLPDDPYI